MISKTSLREIRAHSIIVFTLVLILFVPVGCSQGQQSDEKASGERKPNLIFILSDDLGWGELGCYGQEIIETPNIDRMADEGLRFTHYYAGATVCAPSRSVLITGQHHGHTRVRGNAGRANPTIQALQPGDPSVASVLKEAGYRTGLIGKWGLGNVGKAEMGLPRKHGFDTFFGYLGQRHAHNHFTDFLWENGEKISLPNKVVPVGDSGAGYAEEAKVFTDELFTEKALDFISENQDRPFFLYWSMVIPHANNERKRALGDGANVPDYGPYASKDWPDPDKGHAAMITLMDEYVGRVLDHLKKLGIAENTLVVFTSDNGPHQESGHNVERFNPGGPYSGMKRSLTDGGIRVPFIAWWPGTVKPGVSDYVGYFADWMPTAAELAGGNVPGETDGISIVPTLLGNPDEQTKHEFLYWEFHERNFQQAALYDGRWKGIRSGSPTAPIKLYDQQSDPAEKTDVSARHPEIAKKIGDYLITARTPLPEWQPTWGKAGKTVDLLASKNLDDWKHILADPAVKKEEVWSFNDEGHLVCRGEPLGFLATADEYTHFQLTVEWRWVGEPGNSGVLMRVQSDEPVPTCLEAQLKSGSAGNVMGLRGAVLKGEGLNVKEHPTIGTIHIVPKQAGAEKAPGEWNRYDITAEGEEVRVFLNGVLACEGTGAEVLPGPIGFQSEGGVIEFRTIQLTPLE